MKTRPILSRMTLAALDRSRHRDYWLLMLVCGFPSLLAVVFGVGASFESEGLIYVGWFDRYNFWPMVIVLPLALWVLRRTFAQIAYISPPDVPDPPPPLVMLFRSNPSPQKVYDLLRDWICSPKVMGIALLISIGIQVADLSELVSVYLFDTPLRAGEFDWSVMYQAGLLSKTTNMIFCFFAYILQFLMTTLGIFGITFLTAHNLFFLNRIYQRSRVVAGEEENYITLDLEDVNRCFGFRAANNAFNTQVIALGIAGIVILTSRFSNVTAIDDSMGLQDLLSWSSLAEISFFPDIGQTLLAIGWFLTLFIVSSPALVKLLPRLPGGGLSELSIGVYLREFLTDEQWRYGENPSEKQINLIAAKFARNGFWPTGDNRASQLFFFSFWVFLVILYPIRTNDVSLLVVSLIVLGVIAFGLRSVLLKLLNSSLSYVDERLTNPRPDLLLEDEDKLIRIRGKVFISYRREDSLAYARLLKQSLATHMDESRIFMDLTDIHAGDDFVTTLESAIAECATLIAVIGPQWSNCKGPDGQRRLEKEDDFVRLEIATALTEEKLLIPVLVGNASMPRAEELSADIAALWRRHARELSDSRWEYDVGELALAISEKD